MRVAVRVVLGVLAALLGSMLLLGVAAETAVAAPSPVGVVHHVVAVAPTTSAPSAGTGTNYNQGQQAADAALAKRKLIMAAICVVLLVIVYFGHRAKYKHVLRVKNLQNAKG
jgi:cobalamin synthase